MWSHEYDWCLGDKDTHGTCWKSIDIRCEDRKMTIVWAWIPHTCVEVNVDAISKIQVPLEGESEVDGAHIKGENGGIVWRSKDVNDVERMIDGRDEEIGSDEVDYACHLGVFADERGIGEYG
jgi:hypothetical protein